MDLLSSLTQEWPKVTFGAISLLSYMTLVRCLRWKRYSSIHRQYQPSYQRNGTLIPEEAQKVVVTALQYDMPLLLNYSLAFALFKTYAIAHYRLTYHASTTPSQSSISKILMSTKELSSREGISKRYADTEILIASWVACPINGKVYMDSTGDHGLNCTRRMEASSTDIDAPSTINVSQKAEKHGQDDPRAMIALARVNWLHSKYPIKNEDYLYTLGLFAFEQERWAKLYGWRKLSELEAHAIFVFWMEIGRRMGIKDIPETAEAFKKWIKVGGYLNFLTFITVLFDSFHFIQEYESTALYPSKVNHDVAQFTLDELLYAVPSAFGMKEFARKVAISLLEAGTREGMMYPPQPAYLRLFATSILHTVNFIQKHFCLPRATPRFPVHRELPDFAKNWDGNAQINKSTSKSGTKANATLYRMHPQWYQPQPWYKPESTTFLGQLSDWMLVKLEEMGPLKFEKSGNDEVIEMAERLQGSPIAGPWARN
ncbi:hypothetical protein D9758_015757 [Tetrapyrgos nigripes]|uniref:ER-bound oxygenase mpaB/mpaB'/Rubber oxygenase catalytic domain-containing protein n=1 Tax=Tetrapyrgos nigripes TaxID=182062 RepID=A0A8H5CBY0_9AGAR|nr:hypothetical protein D9758_015757 [Tetrapyrgos nigripes]